MEGELLTKPPTYLPIILTTYLLTYTISLSYLPSHPTHPPTYLTYLPDLPTYNNIIYLFIYLTYELTYVPRGICWLKDKQ